MRCGAGCWRSPPAGEVICLTQCFPAVNAQLKKKRKAHGIIQQLVEMCQICWERWLKSSFFFLFVLDFFPNGCARGSVSATRRRWPITCRTHRPRLRERLHQFNALSVNLDEGQQVPGLNRLEQLDHLGRGRRAGLPCVLVVHVLGVYELLPHRPVQEESNTASLSEF